MFVVFFLISLLKQGDNTQKVILNFISQRNIFLSQRIQSNPDNNEMKSLMMIQMSKLPNIIYTIEYLSLLICTLNKIENEIHLHICVILHTLFKTLQMCSFLQIAYHEAHTTDDYIRWVESIYFDQINMSSAICKSNRNRN